MSAFRYPGAAALIFLAVGSTGPVLAQATPAEIESSHNIRTLSFPAGNSEAALFERLQNDHLLNTLRKNQMLRPRDLDRLKQNPDALMELLRRSGLKPEALETIKRNPALLDLAIDRVKKGEGLPQGARVPPLDVNSALKDLEKEKTEAPQSSPSRPPPTVAQPEATERPGRSAVESAAVKEASAALPPRKVASQERADQEEPRLQFGHKLQGWAEKLQRLAPQLQNSPALQNAMQSLAQSIGREDPKWRRLADAGDSLRERLGDWSKKARLERFWPSGRFHLPDVLPEDMPNITLRALSDRNPSDLSLPRIGSPDASAGRVITLLAWLIGMVAGAVCLRRLWLHLQETNRDRLRKQALLKAWPVDPLGITNREDLIRAYEYLALSRLGMAVKSWNHLAIAAGLGDSPDPQRRNAALCLRDAYEHARYAPVEDALPHEVIVEARRHLCLLAGVTGA